MYSLPATRVYNRVLLNICRLNARPFKTEKLSGSTIAGVNKNKLRILAGGMIAKSIPSVYT